MAKAEVVITAVDRTKAALAQAERGMKGLEKTAKVTGKAINLAFGLITGGLLVSAFGKVAEAAKKTEEGQKAMAELARTLKDPALVAAANAITGTLINGFNVALKAAAAAIKFVRTELIRLGAISGNDARDAAVVVRKQIADIERMIASPGIGFTGESGARLSAQLIADLKARREQLRLIEQLSEAEAKAEAARIDREVAAEQKGDKPAKPSRTSRASKTEKTVSQYAAEITADMRRVFGDKLAGYIAEIRHTQNAERAKALADWQTELVRETDKILKDSADKAGDDVVESITKSYEERFGERVTAMTVFAQEAAKSMQSSFADFLFDPFENGLKGMLAGFLNVIRRMLAELAAQQLLSAFFGAFAGTGGIVGDFASAALAAIKPRAKGGPVTGSSPYLVGERGPELFVPSTAGNIVPNDQIRDGFIPATAGMMQPADRFGGNMTVSPVYNIDARGATQELAQALPTILADNNRRIFDELDRRYGIRR